MSEAALLMDRVYAKQRHIYDITRKFYLLGRDGLIADLDAPNGGRILEIGCGTGRNLIAIARRYPGAECYGLDISSAMLATARRSIARAGLEARVRLAQGDATNFDPKTLFDVMDFDRIAISYALSMIPPWRDVLRHGASMVAPGGALHIVDFGDQSGLPPTFKHLLRAWLAKFHVTPRDTLAMDVAAVARDFDRRASSNLLFRGYAMAARISGP